MEVRIQAIHFDATERLEAFINKKVERMVRHCPDVAGVEVTLKVVKPETVLNKEATIKVTVPNNNPFVVTKVANTFEEAIDLDIDALERMLAKTKDK